MNKVTGMAEILKLFQDLPNNKTRSVIRDSMKKSMKENILTEAEFNAPKKTGKLEESLKVKTISKRKFIGADVITKTDDVFYGRFQEFGSAKNPPTFFMRNAADTEGDKAMNDVIDDILKRVDDVTK